MKFRELSFFLSSYFGCDNFGIINIEQITYSKVTNHFNQLIFHYIRLHVPCFCRFVMLRLLSN